MGALTKLYLHFQQRQLAKNRCKESIDEKSSKFVYRRSIKKLIMGLSDGKEPLECAICISEFKYGDKGRKLENCSHMFHENCLGKWLMHGNGQSTCPLCRDIIILENIFEKQIKDEDEGQTKNSFEEELAMLLLSRLSCSSCWQRC
ncbi:RING-H2 finger protein ATL46-like [Nicotiana tomentosiformis]|uniref:RING-H2 finger protein ATL46-like n=1 Tax=Nicotiana tomentosiformis TaxID=4098 RepID=UPI00051AB550|nr:RING-H2 finger protein ATL46-like [Nicotiana tomentosiformis]